jgi:DNA-binding CsgD family transcriptional regulator
VAACANADSHSPGGALTLARGQRRRPLQVFVTPLRLSDPNRSGVRALVMATDPDKTVVFPDTILRQLYGLTPAETEVANGLLTGFSVEEIARVRRVSISTVRSQLSSLLSKTGVKGQNDLMRLLATLPQNAPEVMGE